MEEGKRKKVALGCFRNQLGSACHYLVPKILGLGIAGIKVYGMVCGCFYVFIGACMGCRRCGSVLCSV